MNILICEICNEQMEFNFYDINKVIFICKNKYCLFPLNSHRLKDYSIVLDRNLYEISSIEIETMIKTFIINKQVE